MAEGNRDKMSLLWEEELEAIKSILAKTALRETIKWGAPAYTHNGKNILGLAALKSYVGVWFYNGCFLRDKDQKLRDTPENETKALRQWRFSSKQEILDNEKTFLEYVTEAVANSEAGLVKKPEPKPSIVSETLQRELNFSAALNSKFQSFSAARQREFFEYIESAKRQETRESRLQKIIPLILDGTGLNDKYRK